MKCNNDKCNTEFEKKGKKKYCSTNCKIVQGVRASRVRRKQMAITYKGGKCATCGYDKCSHALTFHHLNPEEKDFQISSGAYMSWEKLKKELDKCILLCANCHAEEHAKLKEV